MRVLLFGLLFMSVATNAGFSATINEVMGSTASTDDEFIELYNPSAVAEDISGWSIELWDSDDGGAFGTADGASPYVLPAGSSIPAEGYFLLANPEFLANYSAVVDFELPANAIENSSYTLVLNDAADAIVETVFVTDGGAGDAANVAGAVITPDLTVGPDGPNLPAGFARLGDGGSTTYLLEFSPKPAPSATPGAANIPEPSSILIALMGATGVGAAGMRRRLG